MVAKPLKQLFLSVGFSVSCITTCLNMALVPRGFLVMSQNSEVTMVTPSSVANHNSQHLQSFTWEDTYQAEKSCFKVRPDRPDLPDLLPW